MTHPSSGDTLNRILRVGRDILDITSRTLPLDYHEHSPRPPSVTKLPDPPLLLPKLLALGASSTLAQKVDDAYRTRANQLRERSEVAIAKALCQLSQHPSSSSSESHITEILTSAYTSKLQLWIGDAIAAVKSRGLVTTSTAANANDRPRGHVLFNQEYVPLLEHFFDENPFPSHADKVFLAKKSNMTYRQIHVWFQNRRNRIRKGGGTLRKVSISQGATLPMDGLCVRMKKYLKHHQKSQEKRVDSGVGTDVAQAPSLPVPSDILNCPPPLHAFPGPYPPTCSYDPFPVKDGRYYFGETEWPRRPSSLINGRTPISIDDLVGLFSLLHVRDDGYKVDQNGTAKPDSCAATSAITVWPSAAPHPARLPTNAIFRFPVVSWPIVRAPSSQNSAFGRFGHTPMAGFLPNATFAVPLNEGNRKTTPLLKHFPSCNSLDQYRRVPASPSDSLSSSPSSSPPSCLSSRGSPSPQTTRPLLRQTCDTPSALCGSYDTLDFGYDRGFPVSVF